MSNFKLFTDQINHQFNALQKGQELFVVDVPGSELYAHYLASFPEGTNPVFRERAEYDCSNCKGFIRNFGGVVALNPSDLSLRTVWDGEQFEAPYSAVAAAMRSFIETQAVRGLFRVSQPSFSAQKTFATSGDQQQVETYHHFYGTAKGHFVTRDSEQVGNFITSVQVLRDSFERFSLGALDTVLDLIRDKQLYRGEEHRGKVQQFRAALERHRSLSSTFQWRHLAVLAPDLAVSRFKNSVIGTLVEDLSTGVNLEIAVRSFEAKVAPTNYQRTAQVVSQRMVDDALKTIDDLGLSTERRLARLDDVSVNNVLWVDNSSRPLMKGGLAGLLAGAVSAKPTQVKENQVTDIGIGEFLSGILPQAHSMRVLIEPALAGSFVTLTTAVREGGPPLFKWDNPFAWSYAGGVTDAITERVKAAGGNVKALLRFSLSWTNTDDLDLSLEYRDKQGRHAQRLYYGQKKSRIPGLVGGLDVDMNVSGETRTPVENIAFTHLMPGTYIVSVNNFRQRENRDVGFTLQLADETGTTNYAYPLAVGHQKTIECLTATVDAQGNVTYQVAPALSQMSAQITGEKWGVKFGQYADVHCVMLSPNHWDGQTAGNKHWFFLLKDAKTDEQPRGIYNEYLHPDLIKHRKVFDVIGERTKPVLTDEQLSGIGVSSTLRKSVLAEVTSARSKRTYRIQF
jgi:hypothetical protein